MSPSQSGKPSLYTVIGGHGILQNFPYWFSGFLQLLDLFVIETDLALEPSRVFLLLELSVIMADPALDTTLECRRSFLLLEFSVIALNPTIDLALDCTLLNSCSLALALNAALAVFTLTLLRQATIKRVFGKQHQLSCYCSYLKKK
jgi:hypothetical protein